MKTNLKTKILASILLIVTLFAYMPINAIVFAAGEVAETKKMSDCKITLTGVENATYTGKAIVPTKVAVTDETGIALEEDKHYTVKVANNINYGTATVTVTGKTENGYTGTKTATFEINKKDISSLTPELAHVKYTYNGKEQKPEVTVKDGETTLKAGTDYTVNYGNKDTGNVNAGDVPVTVTGKGNYKGTSQAAKFTINAKSIAGVTVEGVTTKAYDPAGAKLNIVVKDGSKELVQKKDGVTAPDYEVSYEENKAIGTNTATVKITAVAGGNYTGEITRDFSIVKKEIKDCKIKEIDNVKYDGTLKTPDVEIMNGNTKVENTEDETNYTVAYKNNVEKGTATVTITGKGNYTGTVSKTFKIVGETIEGATVTNADENKKLNDEIYTGKAIIPNVVVYKDGKKLVNGTDYKVVCDKNTDVGTGATVKIVGIGNYAEELTGYTFDIIQKDIKDCTIEAIPSQVLKEGSACKPAVTIKNGSVILKEGTDYTVDYENNDKVGTAKAIITVVKGDKANYKGDNREVTFNIVSSKSISSCTIAAIADQKYTGKAIEPVVVVKNGNTTLVNGTDYTVAYTNNTNVGTATVTVTGKGAYTGTKTATFKIVKEAAKPAHTHKYTTKITPATMTKNGTIVKTCACGATTKSGIAKVTSIKLNKTTFTYNGKNTTPVVSVVNSNGKQIARNYYTISYSTKSRKNVGKYTVKVTLKGKYTGTKTLSFTVRPKAVTLSKVTAGSKKVTAKWTKQTAQTTGYQVQYATNNKFSKAKTSKVTSNKTTSRTVSKLSAKKKYYVRVRTYKTVNGKTYYSAWSKVKTATTRR